MKVFSRKTSLCWALQVGVFCLTAFGQKPELVVETGHSSDVTSLAFSPDARTLASGSGGGDNRIELWDIASGRELRALVGHTLQVDCIAFAPDGRTIASGSVDNTIRLWDAAKGRELRALRGDTNWLSVTFSPDGRSLASGNSSGMVKLWDVTTGHELRTLLAASSGAKVESVAFSPDGRTLASGSWDFNNKIGIWDVASGRQLQALASGTLRVRSIAFSPDGRTLASGSGDGAVKLWDLSTGHELRTLRAGTGDGTVVACVAFSPDGRTLVSGSAGTGGLIRLWDVASGRELRAPAGRLFFDLPVAFSPDGRTLALPDGDSIKLWDVVNGRELRNLAERSSPWVQSLAFSPDGRTLALGGGNRSSIVLWDLANGRVVRFLAEHSGPWVHSLAFSPDGRSLASGGSNETNIELWDVANGRALKGLVGHTNSVSSVAFSLDGRTVASGSNDDRIKLWDATSGHELRTLPGHGWWVSSVAFSPDGHTLASGGFGSGNAQFVVKLWDATNGQQLQALAGHTSPAMSVAFSPDGHVLASGGGDKTVKLWDVSNGHELRTLAGHKLSINSVAFSPDGSTLASASDDTTIKLWDVASGRELRTLAGHAGQVNSIALRPDGRTLASGSNDATVKLWDVASGREVASLIVIEQSDWVVADREGHFDANNLDEIKGLSWVFPDEPFRALPPEIFLRDYYQPKLLPRLLRGEKLPEVRSLADLNRAQPQVDLLKVEPEPGGKLVAVTVQVTGTQSAVQKDSSGKLLQSGAYDLRLFRDGQLVGQWPEATTSAGRSPGSQEAELQSWRTLHQINLSDREYTRTFAHIRLPQRPGMDKVKFTAYAFNSDRVKSLTTPPYEYKLPTATQAKAVTRRAYLITIGVNANQSRWNLELAVSSAQRARQLLRGKLQSEYQEIVEVPLYSDLAEKGVQVASTRARKAHLQAVLDLLAGRSVAPALRDEVDKDHKLWPATPDDAVVLYIASHGYADPQGNFYLIPYDTGTSWGITEEVLNGCYGKSASSSASCKQAADFLQHAISSTDLAAWWQGVDAGDMVMILDSCHSGAVPGREFRPGPLGDPGLGQLSYDKRMRILCAAQPAQTEQGDWIGGGEGRTLLVEALDTVAQANPSQSLAEWLKGAERQLPVRMRQLYPQIKEVDVQLPELLDFARAANSVEPSSVNELR